MTLRERPQITLPSWLQGTPRDPSVVDAEIAVYRQFLERKAEQIRRRVYIYALLDPDTREVRYVGKSIRPVERLGNHCGDQSSTWRTHWIQQVVRSGRKPILRILEILDRDEDWRAAECRWIASGRANGWPLTNCTSGGDGVSGLPAEIRARMALTWKGRKHSPETLLLMSRNRRGRKHTEEHKEHMRRIMTGRVNTWGAKVGRSVEKLTADDVRQIRDGLSKNISQRVLAERFGVHSGTIYNIKWRVSYAWVI